jgi:predicted signal transduction protein with EAL and GGDEF domain
MSADKSGRSPIELVCIFGIVAVVTGAELRWQFLTSLAGQFVEQFPMLGGNGPAVFAGCWLGLLIYSFRRRVEVKSAQLGQSEAEENFELSKILDPVSGLPNRHGLDCYLHEQIRETNFRAISVLGVQLSNLDSLGSVHGTETVDGVISAFSEQLVGMNVPVSFIARGEKSTFYLVFQQSTQQHQQEIVAKTIERCKVVANAGIKTRGIQLNVYVCFGVLSLDVAAMRSRRWDADGITRRVDYALQVASKRGNESVREYDDQMESTRRRRTIIEASLRDAIDDHKIVPHFQPFVDLETSKIIGFEVLSRWNHPSEGVIGPSIFIPIAEEMGLLRKLTMTVLGQVCDVARDWPAELKLAINISPTDLKNAGTIVEFLDILRSHQMDPSRFELEITENAFIEEIDAVNNIVDGLKQEGLTISIDDFGTGYSSLQHLKSLPFDKIKIDQSFVFDMDKDEESRKIVQAIIALANSLGVHSTAEGVENHNNREELRELGCSFAQGYLFSEPMAADSVLPYLARQSAASEAA